MAMGVSPATSSLRSSLGRCCCTGVAGRLTCEQGNSVGGHASTAQSRAEPTPSARPWRGGGTRSGPARRPQTSPLPSVAHARPAPVLTVWKLGRTPTFAAPVRRRVGTLTSLPVPASDRACVQTVTRMAPCKNLSHSVAAWLQSLHPPGHGLPPPALGPSQPSIAAFVHRPGVSNHPPPCSHSLPHQIQKAALKARQRVAGWRCCPPPAIPGSQAAWARGRRRRRSQVSGWQQLEAPGQWSLGQMWLVGGLSGTPHQFRAWMTASTGGGEGSRGDWPRQVGFVNKPKAQPPTRARHGRNDR